MRLIDADVFRQRLASIAKTFARTDAQRSLMGRCIYCLDKTTTVAEWVSVKDRMPKDEQDVLAYLNDGEETRIAPCIYFKGVWFDCVMNCTVVFQDVTHWMPLPEPPKEDNNEGS